MNWDDLRYLVAIKRHKTLTRAATALGTNVATVSRRIDKIGEKLGSPAFVRTADGWLPSPRIEHLLSVAEEFDQRIEAARNNLDSDGQHIKLTIGAAPLLNTHVLFPALPDLQEEAPELELEFRNRIFKNGLGDCDIVLVQHRPESGRLIAARVVTLPFRIYAHANADLDGDWIGMPDEFEQIGPQAMASAWFKRPPRIRVEHFDQLAEVIQVTETMGPLPDIVAKRYPDLRPISCPDDSYYAPIYAAYHASRRGDRAVATVLDWVRHAFATSTKQNSRTCFPVPESDIA
ncbi:LysR family transcriptional regulator [Maritalea mobilis]|uniref:LysR family transcriptional regulator n=1 Tax=Maritalea mobilis TaxID=483324 RepID=UPI001C953B0E|nr:LysR family transcriptional regulator [Maritalea mobilis]MBY6200065.1 LysR family transcriptional regulator [Maritalea mobilis]